MSKPTEDAPTLAEATKEQPDSEDPEYLAWVNSKIRKAQRELKDAKKRTAAEKVWKELGVED